MSLAPSKPLEELLEKEWASMLFSTKRGLAPSLGWRLNYHTQHSQSSRSGFPDQVLVRDRIVFAELKREKTKPTPRQIEFLDGLARAGGEVYVWRPSDLDEVARILSKRWVLSTGTTPGLTLVEDQFETFWQPKSMWIPGVGRSDQQTPEEPEVPGQTTIHDFVR